MEDQAERVETRLLFQDGTATLIVESYRVLRIFSWYMGGAVLFSLLLFLLPVIIYIYRRMKYLKKIRQQALEMAGGNLECPIKVAGNDEIVFSCSGTGLSPMCLKRADRRREEKLSGKQRS